MLFISAINLISTINSLVTTLYNVVSLNKISFKTFDIIYMLLKTTKSKQYLTDLLIIIISTIVRIHIDFILCSILYTNIYILDFTIQCIVSITCVLNVSIIYNFVKQYHDKIYLFTKYFINNYTYDNYRLWKTYLTIIICIYIYILTCFINITSSHIRYIITQYIICSITIDYIQNKNTSYSILKKIKLMKNKLNKSDQNSHTYEYNLDDIEFNENKYNSCEYSFLPSSSPSSKNQSDNELEFK